MKEYLDLIEPLTDLANAMKRSGNPQTAWLAEQAAIAIETLARDLKQERERNERI